MNVLLVGAGAVGEAIAVLARRIDPKGKWLGGMAVSDYNMQRAEEVAAKTGDGRFVPAPPTSTCRSSMPPSRRDAPTWIWP
jgi:predicted dinucleotide-utilizing enzyme